MCQVSSLKSVRASCCGATVGSELQHNQDLKEIYEERRILEFITFYQNALHLTTFFTECIAFNQSALCYFFTRMHCDRDNSTKNTTKSVHRSLPRLGVFFVANFLQHG